MVFDITIIGNGIVGTMSAFQVSKEFKNKKIAFISPPEEKDLHLRQLVQC